MIQRSGRLFPSFANSSKMSCGILSPQPDNSSFDDSRLAVDMQPDGIPKKIENEHGYMRVLGNVPEVGKDAIAAVFGVSEILLAQHADETGFAELRGAIALSVTVGGRHKQELLPGDEVAHQRGQKAQDLAAVKAIGPLFRAIFRLQCSPSEPG